MPELVTIPISFFEVTFEYQHPNLTLWGGRASIAQAIFDALQPWNPNIDDVESPSTGKLSQQGLLFKLPLKTASFFFGPASCRFSRDSVDWTMAEETMAIIEAATSAFVSLSGAVMGSRKTVIGLHIQPRTVPFIQILQPFMPSQISALEKAPLQTMAVVAKWDKRRVTFDGSGNLANGLFLKFEREFDSSISLSDIAEQLWKDEKELFVILGIEEDQ
jgi:hypothetical protein